MVYNEHWNLNGTGPKKLNFAGYTGFSRPWKSKTGIPQMHTGASLFSKRSLVDLKMHQNQWSTVDRGGNLRHERVHLSKGMQVGKCRIKL